MDRSAKHKGGGPHMKIYAFIPARSGSKGLPDKNIRKINGHPLLAYSVAFGLALDIDRVIVSTDSEQYAEIARHYGAECPYLRGAEASSDTAMEELIIEDMSKNLGQFDIDMPDIWLRLKPTNPFRNLETVKGALDIMCSSDPPDSVRIVSKTESRICGINDQGWLEPSVPGWDPNRSVMRRTEFPEAYSPFNLDILFHQNWVNWGSAYMGKRIHPVVDHGITGIDVNDEDDFDIIKSIIEAKPRPRIVGQYLKEPSAAPYQ